MSEEKEFKDLAEQMDLSKTGDIFDSLIERSKVNNKGLPLDEAEIKKVKTVLGAGNLHVNAARVKVGALRLVGYRDNLSKLKIAIERKSRNARKPR